MRIQQYEMDIETRTKDNVFVTIKLAMRVKVAERESEFPKPRPVHKKKKVKQQADKKLKPDGSDDKVGAESSSEEEDEEVEISVPTNVGKKELLYLAHYKLKNPIQQVTAYIDNYFRFHAMEYSLDDMYSAKDEMTNDLLNKLNAKVNPFGYIVFDILVKDILPNTKVRNAMNEVVASEKEKIATVNRAQADKAAKILAAEAEARTRELEGEGIANARRAIILGLRQSVDEFQQAIPGAEAGSLLTTVLMTQYMDTIKEAASKGRNTFLLPSSPAQVGAIEDQMRQALLASERVSRQHDNEDD